MQYNFNQKRGLFFHSLFLLLLSRVASSLSLFPSPLSLSPSDKISFRGGVGVAREKGPLQLRAKDQREGPLKGLLSSPNKNTFFLTFLPFIF